MNFNIDHKIRYDYSAPVFLEPHILRLCPRNDASQLTKNWLLTVEPQPAGQHNFLDAEGNQAACLWFEDKIDSLIISTSFEAETFYSNPFDYLITDSNFLQLPAVYTGAEAVALFPYLAISYSNDDIRAFILPILKESAGKTMDFLSLLNSLLYENFSVEIRKDGEALSPVMTLQEKKGACRDLAVLFIAACRTLGLAARFVSGYHEGDRDMQFRELHAWAEVYIPGGGWRGYDPTLGLAVAERHIALAASHSPMGAAPVSGNYRGSGISATMSYSIELKTRAE